MMPAHGDSAFLTYFHCATEAEQRWVIHAIGDAFFC
jgi:hypothetical protein